MTNELSYTVDGSNVMDQRLVEMTAQRDHWLEMAREKDAKIDRLSTENRLLMQYARQGRTDLSDEEIIRLLKTLPRPTLPTGEELRADENAAPSAENPSDLRNEGTRAAVGAVHADPTGKTREPPHCPSCSCGMETQPFVPGADFVLEPAQKSTCDHKRKWHDTFKGVRVCDDCGTEFMSIPALP